MRVAELPRPSLGNCTASLPPHSIRWPVGGEEEDYRGRDY